MASKEMYALGSQASVIRDLFAYGQQQAAVVGKENVFDFSIGNPTVPAPACVKEAIEDIMETRESAAIHGYTAAAGDTAVRQGLADFMNQTYDAQVRADNFYMTCGAAASLTISLKALVESPDDEIILIAPSSRNIRSSSRMPMPNPSSCRRIRNTSRFPWMPWKRPLRLIRGQSSSISRTTRLASSIPPILMKNWPLC